MYKNLFFYFVFFLGTFSGFSQQIEGKILNFITKKPIVNAAIQANNKIGSTSNDQGVFLINISKVDSLTISSLGFKTKTIGVSELIQNNYIILLQEDSFELEEFSLNTTKISLDAILSKTSSIMKGNRLESTFKRKFYSRENTKIKFEKVELELKRSTLLSRKKKKLAEKELEVFSNKIKESNPNVSSEFYGNLLKTKVLSKKLKKKVISTEIDSLSGYKTIDETKDFTINSISDKMQELILKHLNKEETYKVKTGLFKIEDSISLASLSDLNDSLDVKNTFQRYEPLNSINAAKKMERSFKKDDENNFLSRKYYNHKLLQNEYFGDENNFVISFKPRKSKAKLTGKLYINTNNYTISKIIYSYAKGKRGQHVNLKLLLGVKFSEDIRTGVVHFKTNNENKFYINYFKESIGIYTYVSRPFKFIENSRDKHKVKFNLKFELSSLETKELLYDGSQLDIPVNISELNKKKAKKRIPYLSKNDYLNTTWKNRLLVNKYLNNLEITQ